MARADAIRQWLDEIDRLDRVLDRHADERIYGTLSERQRARRVMDQAVEGLAQSLSSDELFRAMEEGRLHPEEVDYLRSLRRREVMRERERERTAEQEHEQ